MIRLLFAFLLGCCTLFAAAAPPPDSMVVKNSEFNILFQQQGIGSIRRVSDTFSTNYILPGKLLGEAMVRYRQGKEVDSAFSPEGKTTFYLDGKLINEWTPADHQQDLHINQSFDLQPHSLTWTINIVNSSHQTITVEDLALPMFYNNGEIENPKEIFEQRVIQHQFVSGNNSFLFWERPSGVGPYLLMMPLAGTALEYFNTSPYRGSDPVYQAFVHASYTQQHTAGSWRQPVTSVNIAAGGQRSYRFRLRWAKDYNDIRNILVTEGLIDVHIAPGMTVPSDLEALVALRTQQTIQTITPEFPAQTDIQFIGEKNKGTRLYKIRFAKLGENKLTILYGGNRKTYLEFFVTEPLETLYKKRASFIVNHQQHTDSTKWYDGLFSVWDMKDSVLRGPDNDDGFNKSRLTYLLTCDDPALSKAPFVAAKNVFFPNQKEIDAVEYYVQHYVWGGLQRTDKETNPYGIYGTPNWLVGRDSLKRAANLNDPNRNKMHIWRSYDYPHIIMLYYHLYQVASLYPGMTHYLTKRDYLIRAKETAKAYFTYPYQILPWYETYKWGCYNELLIPGLIEDLKKEGFEEDAAWLTGEWEKKVKYFVYDDPYPFRSEYAVDATAYESTHAFANYALTHDMKPDTMLWYDQNLQKWYSHPTISKKEAHRFMQAQMQANIASRGWLEPAYYYLGSDFRGRSDVYLLSYMAQMGGWAVLDYGLNYASQPANYLQLGYASYLSSFALMNTGTPESGYGFWYGGKENDGATGWAFEPQQHAVTWIEKPQGRGAWYYDGEIDLGYGGATRAAATIIAKDPTFGTIAYGGSLRVDGSQLYVIPKDGVRQKLYCRMDNDKFDLVLNRDGFAKGKEVLLNPVKHTVQCLVENRSNDAHLTSLFIKGWGGTFRVWINGKEAPGVVLQSNGSTVNIPVLPRHSPVTVTISRDGRKR